MKLWGGRFKGEQNDSMEAFNSSFGFDKRLFHEDITGSIAHAEMLGKCGIISKKDSEDIIAALKTILKELEEGVLTFEGKYEDIHSFVESVLTERIGDAGKRLHTSRSRNDQVALDMRMFTRAAGHEVIEFLKKLIESLENCGNSNNTIMPGYTHLQRAQAVTLKHHLGAYCSMFKRDVKRLEGTLEIMNESPLGCCALAGTTYSIDREYTASKLGFNKPVANFMDGVSDRDYLLQMMSDFSIIMMHLSRLSEELILWSSQEFKFITMSDEYSTGSSIMPQKKNPDAAELIRGKTGRVYGNLMGLLTTMKGIPLAYNKDMQEDKEQFFDSFDTVTACLNIMAGVISTMKVNKDKTMGAVKAGFLNATEVADYLVTKGVTFRDAHRYSGEIVLICEEKGKAIEELTLEEFKSINDAFEEDIYSFIDYKNILNKGIKKQML